LTFKGLRHLKTSDCSEAKEQAMAKPGRPRSFDKEKALDAALQVFWRKGYEGASLADLTSAMGIEKPSMYAAFGDKEQLFRQVLEHYERKHAAYMFAALIEPTARRVVEKLLRESADAGANPKTPRGCLFVQGALACGGQADCVRMELISRRAAGEAALRKRLQRARKEGDLPKRSDPAGLARYIMAVLHGMSVRSSAGATRRELRGIAETALRGLQKEL
jgi:AcrR family transcriptional regulator